MIIGFKPKGWTENASCSCLSRSVFEKTVREAPIFGMNQKFRLHTIEDRPSVLECWLEETGRCLVELSYAQDDESLRKECSVLYAKAMTKCHKDVNAARHCLYHPRDMEAIGSLPTNLWSLVYMVRTSKTFSSPSAFLRRQVFTDEQKRIYDQLPSEVMRHLVKRPGMD